MAFLDQRRGLCRSSDGSVAVPADRLRHKLPTLNRITAPFVVRPDDGPAAEWRIVDGCGWIWRG